MRAGSHRAGARHVETVVRRVAGGTGRRGRTLAAVAPALLALVACGSGSASPPAGVITVTATDDRCDVSTATTTAGSHSFSFKNTGRGLNELYIYSGTTVVGEKENIGPGLTGELAVDLPAGPIEVACKPGGVGDGIRSALTVTPAGAG